MKKTKFDNLRPNAIFYLKNDNAWGRYQKMPLSDETKDNFIFGNGCANCCPQPIKSLWAHKILDDRRYLEDYIWNTMNIGYDDNFKAYRVHLCPDVEVYVED